MLLLHFLDLASNCLFSLRLCDTACLDYCILDSSLYLPFLIFLGFLLLYIQGLLDGLSDGLLNFSIQIYLKLINFFLDHALYCLFCDPCHNIFCHYFLLLLYLFQFVMFLLHVLFHLLQLSCPHFRDFLLFTLIFLHSFFDLTFDADIYFEFRSACAVGTIVVSHRRDTGV